MATGGNYKTSGSLTTTLNKPSNVYNIKPTYQHTISPGVSVYSTDTTWFQSKKKKEKKKMGWFRRKFLEWSKRAWEDQRHQEIDVNSAVKGREGVNGKSSVRFTVYTAQGGHIIEYYKQDRYRDSEGPELVICTGDQPIGQAVEHILTLEALKS